MDPVNQLNRMMQALRRQVATPSGAETTAKAARTHLAPKRAGDDRADLEQIRARLRERLQQLEPAQRDGAQATQIFVETVLAWEFGEQLLGDPKFDALRREVQYTLMGDRETRRQVSALLKSL